MWMCECANVQTNREERVGSNPLPYAAIHHLHIRAIFLCTINRCQAELVEAYYLLLRVPRD